MSWLSDNFYFRVKTGQESVTGTRGGLIPGEYRGAAVRQSGMRSCSSWFVIKEFDQSQQAQSEITQECDTTADNAHYQPCECDEFLLYRRGQELVNPYNQPGTKKKYTSTQDQQE